MSVINLVNADMPRTIASVPPDAGVAWGGIVPLVGRFLIAIIFGISVVQKIQEPAATIAYIKSAELPLPPAAYAIDVLVELVGGLALMFGYRTRIAGVALALFCIAAALGFHSNLVDGNQLIHFFKNVAMAGGLLQVAAFGAGSLSIDWIIRRRKDYGL